MASIAAHLLAWAGSNGAILTPEQIAQIPDYQQALYAEELAIHRQHLAERVGSESSPALQGIRAAAELLRKIGWRLLDVSANEATGFVRVVAESRDTQSGTGVQVLVQRSTHDGQVLEMRSRVERVPGMFRDHWTVGAHLGRRTHDTIADAARQLLRYACDNGANGGLPLEEAASRAAIVSLALGEAA